MASVLKRQSTYWDIGECGETIRIHFLGKEEFYFRAGDFDRWTILTNDPLLAEYEHPWERVFIGNQPSSPELLTNTLVTAARSSSPRNPHTYFNELGMTSILKGGHGLLFDGPQPMAKEMAVLLDLAGVRVRIFQSRKPNWPMKILRAGRSYVVAKDFREEPIST